MSFRHWFEVENFYSFRCELFRWSNKVFPADCWFIAISRWNCWWMGVIIFWLFMRTGLCVFFNSNVWTWLCLLSFKGRLGAFHLTCWRRHYFIWSSRLLWECLAWFWCRLFGLNTLFILEKRRKGIGGRSTNASVVFASSFDPIKIGRQVCCLFGRPSWDGRFQVGNGDIFKCVFVFAQLNIFDWTELWFFFNMDCVLKRPFIFSLRAKGYGIVI